MTLGEYLRELRNKRQLSLRDVERLAKEIKVGAELSSGYLSILERDEVKDPSPRILYSLSRIYETDFIEIMKIANYLPDKMAIGEHTPRVAFRGASQLNQEQQERIHRLIDFEVNDSKKKKLK